VGDAPPGVRGGLRLLIASRDYWVISYAAAIGYGVYAALQTLWAGPYLMEVMGCSALGAGSLILLLSFGSILGGPFWGALSDRLFQKRKTVVCFGQAALCLLFLLLAEAPRASGSFWLGVLFCGVGFFRSTGHLVYTHIKELMPIRIAGAAMTGVNFFNMIGPAVFLQGLGSLMQGLYPGASRGPAAFRTAFLLCSAFLISLCLLYLLTSEKKRPSH
jgi:sugar phosphate permease